MRQEWVKFWNRFLDPDTDYAKATPADLHSMLAWWVRVEEITWAEGRRRLGEYKAFTDRAAEFLVLAAAERGIGPSFASVIRRATLLRIALSDERTTWEGTRRPARALSRAERKLLDRANNLMQDLEARFRAESQKPRSGKRSRSKQTRTEKVALLVTAVRDNPNASDRELQDLTGIPPSTFRAWPEYKAAREATMGDAPARGYTKTGKRIEATRDRLPAPGRRARPRDD